MLYNFPKDARNLAMAEQLQAKRHIGNRMNENITVDKYYGHTVDDYARSIYGDKSSGMFTMVNASREYHIGN